MDTIVHAALDEICSQGVTGITLSLLWPRLTAALSAAELPLCSSVNCAVFSSLAAVPGLRFSFPDGGDIDVKSTTYEECEGLDVKVFADEQLRRCFVGLYDVKASNITPPQQRVLERLALARGSGVTQNQLCKELGIPANNFFYVVKRLESWGLVVRQSTIVRTKEASGGNDPKSSQPVHTNLIRLHRYAPALSSHQRLEITKENKNLDEFPVENVNGPDPVFEESGQDDVFVKDFMPALKAVCERLEQAEGKVLVVSDIKKEFGYREARGHRAWRNVCNRLKQAGLVEVFEAKVKNEVETPNKKSRSRGQNKPVSCLRLLKKFSPKLFEQKAPDVEVNNDVSEHSSISGKRVQNTEQLVELPLEQQIVDMIDAEGSSGLLGVDVCRRLGIGNRMFENLSTTIVPRFGLHQLSENHKRGSAYRFWTRGNFCPGFTSSINKSEDDHTVDGLALSSVSEPSQIGQSRKTITFEDYLNSHIWLAGENVGKRAVTLESEHGSQGDRGPGEMVVWAGRSEDSGHNMSITVPDAANNCESNSLVLASYSPVPKPFNLQQGQRYPSLTSAKRELRILERLETEKIIIKPDLQRWLESFEKDNQSRMDRKTLMRCLKKLTHEGLCKLMDFNIPGVSNCGRHREVKVVLHPSVKGSASELSEQVYDKMRSFEMQIRSALSQPKKEVPVPVLHGIERIQVNPISNTGNLKSEIMRANGFVLAKMVRTKLLHCFLWDYVHNSDGSIEVSSLIKPVELPWNPHSSCLLFSLDAAVKAMPFELFLQVVGTALKWKDMTEKCKNGLLLSDLPGEEYKSLLDTRASNRLSWLIDILRRLKLIKLLADESVKEAVKSSHTTLAYALELKPYIEEPASVDPLHGRSSSVDLRPHFRHDFVLSSSEALEKYWQTLEYCYSAADPKAAIHAFPGSVAYEVCLYRSWTTVRVMKAEQRSELLKRIKNQRSKKLTFKECSEIAKDLNLSLEQVLRVYYDNRQQRLDRFQEDLNVQVIASDVRNDRPSESRLKRKRSSEGGSVNLFKIRHATELHEHEEGHNMEQPGVPDEKEQQESSIGEGIIPMLKPTRQPKFPWTEEADRCLLIKYARQRAIQGAKRGTDWASISDLPAPSHKCSKRLAVLNRDVKFRKSLMRLCNLLTQRCAEHLDREKNLILTNEREEELDSQVKCWDDFDDSKIKAALNEVLMLKQISKLDPAKRTGSASEGIHSPIASTSYGFENDGEHLNIGSTRKSRRNRLPQKFVKHLKERVSISGRVNQSLAISNAVELFKLVFLTNSKSAEMPNLLAKTLRCYSEHDLFSAFDYLRQKKIMIGSGPSQPFVLSQNFLRSLSLSLFPTNTGKRAAKLANWICEKDMKLMEDMINLPSDLQCGDIFHLFGLISSGELSILPILPHEGVGEAEDSRSSKRKYVDDEFDDFGLSKRYKYLSLQDCEFFSRREKGFPGLTVSVTLNVISRPSIVDTLNYEDQNLLLSDNDHFYGTLSQKLNCTKLSVDQGKEPPDFGSIVPGTVINGDSVWEVMANYITQNFPERPDQQQITIHAELMKAAYSHIQKAGDQGLSMLKFSECVGMQGTNLPEHVISVLELFGFVSKVNGYDYVHVVDGLYRTKYFLTSKVTWSQGSERSPLSIEQRTNLVEDVENHDHEMKNADKVHKVTILNLSEESSQLSNTIQVHEEIEGCNQTSTQSTEGNEKNQNCDVAAAFQPILPWINGDGTINGIVYRGLTRRVLGIVTQNPGILEDGILNQMEVLNPQSCRKLLELMILDNHLLVRKMSQRTSSSTPPALLKSLRHDGFKEPKYVVREHYFANPLSTSLL